MKILLFVFLRYSRNLLLIWELVNSFGKLFKILFTLWATPIDSGIFELFNALAENNDTTTSKKLENVFYITVVVFCVVVLYYTFFTGGEGGIDLSNFRRIVPEEAPKISMNDDGDFFVSLLDEKTSIDAGSSSKMTSDTVAGPVISKHW